MKVQDCTPAAGVVGPAAGIDCLLRPKSVAILGVSSRAGSAGQIVLNNLLAGGYKGEILLVGRSGGTIGGRTILTEVTQLREGIDLAILMVPAEGLRETVEQCVMLKIRSAVCFASGFAEMGAEGRAQQQEVARIAREGNLALLGPNTIGYFNFVDSFHVMLVDLKAASPLRADSGRALAIVAQSGGIATHVAGSLQSRALPISYMMTTGNEAVLSISDMLSFLVDDDRTGVVAVYAEQIKSPEVFLAAARKARAKGKRVVLLHSGKCEKGKAATSSHTGALAGNHAAITLVAEQAGVLVVDTMEELIDLSQLLLHFPDPCTGGLGILTASGALCALTQDYVEPLALEIPPLSDAQIQGLTSVLPEFLPPRNPLDMGTLIAWKPELVGLAAKEMLADPAIGSLLISLPMADPEMSVAWMKAYLEASRGSRKPTIYVIHSEDKPLAPDLVKLAEDGDVILMRSNERSLRALACFTRFEKTARSMDTRDEAKPFLGLPILGRGPQAEWMGKKTIAAIGIRVPEGALASSADDAVEIAHRVGFPVVLKAQAASLAHKSEVGGVLLNLQDETAVRSAWDLLHQNVRRAMLGLALDGALVEAMSPRGLELVVGATRDDQWGPIIMVGLGGIWVEALGDVRLLTPNLSHDAIVRELGQLRAAKLLQGFRGAAPIDIDAVAEVVRSVGRLMLTEPAIVEIDINPLIAYPRGEGVIALDALIVTR